MFKPGLASATSLAGANACFSTVMVRIGLILPEGNTEAIFKVALSVNFNGSVYLAEAGVGSEPSSV